MIVRGFVRPGLAGLALVLVVAFSMEARAADPVRRAVVIGIDNYSPRSQGVTDAKPAAIPGRIEWRDLSGAAADAQVMQNLLVTRFGFKPENVRALYNADATRVNILTAIKETLLVPSKPGDIVVLYYAGHGSQVANSLSTEADKLDESLVPADSWKGALDLRDKELAKGVLNPLLKKGVVLTAIFDSCHSGSIGRGKTSETPRFLAFDPRDVKDADEPPAPEDKGALIFSGAQQDEFAWEAIDDDNHPRGRFTWALQRAILQAAPGESAERIFQRVRALMASTSENGQQPVLAGTKERVQAPFLGDTGGAIQHGTVVAFSGEGKDQCQLQGGRDLMLTPGTELVNADADAGKTPARVKITSVDGLTTSSCALLGGDAGHLKKGRLFRVEKFGPPDIPTLKVEIVPSTLTAETLAAEASKVRAAAEKAGLEWIDDPATGPRAAHLVHYGSDGHWKLQSFGGAEVDLGAKLDPAAVQAALAKAKDAAKDVADPARHRLYVRGLQAGTPTYVAVRTAAEKAGLKWITSMPEETTHRLFCAPAGCSMTARNGEQLPFAATDGAEALAKRFTELHARFDGDKDPARLRIALELPAPKGLAEALTAGTPSMSGVERASPALYRLVGRASKDGTVELAWRLLGNASARATYPPRTSFVAAGDTASFALDESVMALAQIHGWLSLNPPPGDGTFPWRLELVDSVTGAPAQTLEESRLRYKLVLRSPVPVHRADPRFVYVFILDREGRMSLLYPRKNTTGVENRFPAANAPPQDVYELPTKLAIGPPFGTDTYVLVTSAEPLGDPAIFDRDPVLVKGRGGPDPRATKAGLLFTRIGSASRGAGAMDETPSTWSVQQLSIESVAAPAVTEQKGSNP